MLPGLSAFPRLTTLKVPEQLLHQHVRNVIDGEPVTLEDPEPTWLHPDLRMEFLPPSLEVLVVGRCSGVVYHYLKTLMVHGDMLPRLRRVDLEANCLEGMWEFEERVDEQGRWRGHYEGRMGGFWKTPEGCGIRFRVFQDFYRNTWVG